MKVTTILAATVVTLGVGIMLFRKKSMLPNLPANFTSPKEIGKFPSQAEEPVYTSPPASQTDDFPSAPASIQPAVDVRVDVPSTSIPADYVAPPLPPASSGTVCEISNTAGVLDYEKRTGTQLIKNSDLMNMTMNDFATWITGKKTMAGCFPTTS